MERDINKMLSMLIAMSMQSDCEMFNMGDWSEQKMEKALAYKQECVDKLKKSKTSIKTMPVELLYEAAHDFVLYLRTFGPEDGLEGLQDVEHILARHIALQKHGIRSDDTEKFWSYYRGLSMVDKIKLLGFVHPKIS
jgi:hypothetical protein